MSYQKEGLAGLGFFWYNNDKEDLSMTHSLSIHFRIPTPMRSTAVHNIEWREFTPQYKGYLHLSAHGSKMKNHLRAEKVAFWNILIPRLKTEPKFIPNYDVYKKDYQTKMWAFLGISAILLLGIVILLVLLIRAKMREIQRTHWDDPMQRNGHGPTHV